jgi:hypothetical protein
MNKGKYKRKGLWIILIVVIVLGFYFGRDIYLKQKYPCQYRPYASLMKEYPELEIIWNRKIAFLDAREAAQKILSAKLELAIKRGRMTEAKALEIEQKMFDQTLAGEEKIDTEFGATCRRLTGTQ